MVTDKLTLSLLSRMADVQLALATGMRGITPGTHEYPEQALQRITHAMEIVEAAILDIQMIKSTSNSNRGTKLH
jgi:hypothetical protein